jgi:hypothetical protein
MRMILASICLSTPLCVLVHHLVCHQKTDKACYGIHKLLAYSMPIVVQERITFKQLQFLSMHLVAAILDPTLKCAYSDKAPMSQ